jgi:hypothetical protein
MAIAGEGASKWPAVFEMDFEEGGLERWEPTDTAAWRIAEDEGNKVYNLFKASQYEPEVRSPRNISLIKGLTVGSFVLDVKLKSTTKKYGHRDMCLFFGHQDASHFYYVHIAPQADPHAHSIFLVDGSPRRSIAKERTAGTTWGETWHHVRLVRSAESGVIKVFFDDMDKPIMSTVDKTFTTGRIGVGSFDDTGMVDELRIRAPKS